MVRTVDEILEQIGQMGRFQISRLSIICFLMFPPTFQLLNMFFIGAEAPWQCVKNSTTCKLNGSFVAGNDNYDFRCGISRSDWEYASYEGPHDSIIKEFDLVCDDAIYGWLAKSMVYIGTTVASLPLGMISDRFGRLVTIYPSLLFIIIVGFASAFATKYWQFLVSRFFIGAVIYGIFLPVFVMSGEFVGPRYRPLSQIIMWFAFTCVLLLLGLMAYFVRTWRTLMILCTAPWIFILVFWWFTPESIRWYLTHNKIGKAEESLRQIAKANKKDYLEGSLKIPTVPKKNLSCLALFSSWSVTINVLIQGFVWFVIGMGYFGASYGASDLGGSMYLNFVVISLVEFPANALAIDNLERYGRKKSTIVTMIIGGICCFIVSLIPSGTDRTDYLVGRVIGGTLGKGFFTFAFDTVFVWSGEIFPTVVRNSGMAFVSIASRIGAVCAPFVVELKRIHPILPFGLMGGLAIAGSLCCLALPETRGMPTADVYENNNDASELMVLEKYPNDEINEGSAYDSI